MSRAEGNIAGAEWPGAPVPPGSDVSRACTETDTGFIIETDAGPVTVATTDHTEWDDFGDHELAVGDMVKVEGCWGGDVLVAEEVELKMEAKLRRAA